VAGAREEPSEVYYTTHQVARFLGVTVPTIVNWIRAGRMSAHRTPGGHRRIAQREVVRLADEHGFPLPREFWRSDTETTRVVVVDDDEHFADTVRDYLSAKGHYEVSIARTPFEAGYQIGRWRPDVVVCDPRVARLDGLALARWLREHPETRGVVLMACTMLDDPEEPGLADAFDEVLQKPIRLQTLLRAVERHLRDEEEE